MANKTKNEWKVIPIDELPDGEPVIAATEFANKSLAKFHLVEHVLYPLDGDWQFTKTKKQKKEPANG